MRDSLTSSSPGFALMPSCCSIIVSPNLPREALTQLTIRINNIPFLEDYTSAKEIGIGMKLSILCHDKDHIMTFPFLFTNLVDQLLSF